MSDHEKRPATFQLHPIGYIHAAENDIYLEILEPYRPALKQLDQFGHVIVLWWGNRNDNEQARGVTQCRPPYAADTVTGIFACRAEYRPNPVLLTVCQVLSVDEEKGLVHLPYIDAEDGTPIVDLKAYFPVCDRVRDVRMPAWVAGWPAWVEDADQLSF